MRLALLALAATAAAAYPSNPAAEQKHEFDAWRLAQFDRDGVAFGSRRSSINMRALSPVATAAAAKQQQPASLKGRVAVLTMGEAAAEQGAALERVLAERSPGALLLLLPPTDAELAALDDATLASYAAVERALLARRDGSGGGGGGEGEGGAALAPLDIPVYFARSDDRLAALTGASGAGASGAALSHLQTLSFGGLLADGSGRAADLPGAGGGGGTSGAAASKLPEAVPSISMVNFQGWLTGGKRPKGAAAAAAASAAAEKAEKAAAEAAAAEVEKKEEKKEKKPVVDEVALAKLREAAAAAKEKAAALAATATKADAAADDFDEFDAPAGDGTAAHEAAAQAAAEAAAAVAALRAAEAGGNDVSGEAGDAAAAMAATAGEGEQGSKRATSGSHGGSGLSLPTIAIVAHWDTFGAAPDGAGSGADGNGSGVVGVLELARIFARLYGNGGSKDKDAHAPYNLLFLLSAGGHLNYAGSREWLQAADERILDSLEFVLCLDSIGSHGGSHGGGKGNAAAAAAESEAEAEAEAEAAVASSPLYLHVSKPKEKDALTRRVYGAFEATAAAMGVAFELVHKKIDVSRREALAWEHEQFALHRLLAATLSHRRSPVGGPAGGGAVAAQAAATGSSSSLFDRAAMKASSSRKNNNGNGVGVDVALLARNIKFVAESVAQLVYGLDGGGGGGGGGGSGGGVGTGLAVEVAPTGSAVGVNPTFVGAWVRLLGAHSRASSLGEMAAPLAGAIEGALRNATHGATARFSLAEPYTFYTHSAARLGLYTVKGAAFDLNLAVCVLAYLLALHAAMVGPANVSAKSVQELFNKA